MDATSEQELTYMILWNNKVLTALKARQTLKHLFISVNHRSIHSHAFPLTKFWKDLKGFRNLTSLELYHFIGSWDLLAKDIAFLLKGSPSLKLLGLGKVVDIRSEEFLPRICQQYASYEGTVPLSLKTLKLGWGLGMTEGSRLRFGSYLEALVKLEEIETLHLCNRPRLLDQQRNTSVDWSLFEQCTSVRQLAVTNITDEVCTWINDRTDIVELIVSKHYGMYDQELPFFNDLKLPQLSMLFVREISVAETMEKDIDTLKKTNCLGVCRSAISVLDRLPDGGIHLTRLAICLDFGLQWVSKRHQFSFLLN
jgi:hypothetical protein